MPAVFCRRASRARVARVSAADYYLQFWGTACVSGGAQLSRAQNSSAVAELIGDIYEAAAAPERWPNFVAHLTERAPDCFALIGVLDREPRFSLNLGLSGLGAGAVKSYQQHFIRVNPWIRGMLTAPA